MSLWVKGRLEAYRLTLCNSLCWSLYCANTLKIHHNWTVITRTCNSSSPSSLLCLFHFISQFVFCSWANYSHFPFCHILAIHYKSFLQCRLVEEDRRQCTKVTCDLYWYYRKPAFSCWFSWKMVQLPVLSRGYQWHDCSVLRTSYVKLLFS